MARDTRLDELKRIARLVGEAAGRSIGERQLLEAIDQPDLIEAIARRVCELGLRQSVLKGSCTNIDGWTARQGSDGYWRLYKTVDGRTESIYLGKRFSWEKASRKIAKKEKKLGIAYW